MSSVTSPTTGRAIYIVPKNYQKTSVSPPMVQPQTINGNNNRTLRRANILPQRCGNNEQQSPRIFQRTTPVYSTSKIYHSAQTISVNPIQQQKIIQRQNPIKQVRLSNPQPVSLRKRQYQTSINDEESDDMIDIEEVYSLIGEDCYSQSINAVPRKRERLNNLTTEEKLNRRKMKNRVAAQTARDRKKERSQRLEKAVKNLLSESTRLRVENRNLLIENQRLRKQNEELLSMTSSSSFEPVNSIQSRSMGLNVKSVQQGHEAPLQTSLDSLNTFGSAESINESLPWKQVFKASQTTAPTFKQLENQRNLFTIIYPFLLTILSTIMNSQTTIIQSSVKKAMTMNFKPYSRSYSTHKMFRILITFATKSSTKKLPSNKVQRSTTTHKKLVHQSRIRHLQTDRSTSQSRHPSTLFKRQSFQMKRRRTPRKLLNGLGPPPPRKVNAVN